jgi:hypothetical protein
VSSAATTTDDLIEATTHALTIAANEAALFVSGDGRVSEADAAGLLGYSANYLRQLRGEGKGPAAYSIGINGGRISYRLADLAAWIESRRENFYEE